MQTYINRLTDKDIKEMLQKTDSPFTLPVDLASNLKDKKGNKINAITRLDKKITDVDKVQLTCIIPDEKNIRKKVICDFIFDDFGCSAITTRNLKITENYCHFLCSQMNNVFVKYCAKKFGQEYLDDYVKHQNNNKVKNNNETLEM